MGKIAILLSVVIVGFLFDIPACSTKDTSLNCFECSYWYEGMGNLVPKIPFRKDLEYSNYCKSPWESRPPPAKKRPGSDYYCATRRTYFYYADDHNKNFTGDLDLFEEVVERYIANAKEETKGNCGGQAEVLLNQTTVRDKGIHQWYVNRTYTCCDEGSLCNGTTAVKFTFFSLMAAILLTYII